MVDAEFSINGAKLKAIVNAYRELVSGFVFHFTREDVSASVMDLDHSRMIDLHLTPYDYRCYVDEVLVRGDMGVLWGAVKGLKKAETVRVVVRDGKFYVGTVQPGVVVPEEELLEEERFKPPELVDAASLSVVVSDFRRVLKSVPADFVHVGFDIDAPEGHLLFSNVKHSILDLGPRQLTEWLLGMKGKTRVLYDRLLFTALFVMGLSELADIHLTTQDVATINYEEDEYTLRFYIAPKISGEEKITEILAKPRPVRTEIMQMTERTIKNVLKVVKAIDQVSPDGGLTIAPRGEGLILYWRNGYKGYLRVEPVYLERWDPPAERIAGLFYTSGLIRLLKDLETLRLFLEVFEGERRLVLVGVGPKVAPKELVADQTIAEVEIPDVRGVEIFMGPVDLLKRTVEDADVADDDYLVFLTTPYVIEAFGRNAVYYEATFELDDFKVMVEEDHVSISGDYFKPLARFFGLITDGFCVVGRSEERATDIYLACETALGSFRAIVPQEVYQIEAAEEAYRKRVAKPPTPPEVEKLPVAPLPKPEYLRIPYGIEDLVGARISYLEAILPDWKLVERLGPLNRPDERVSMHAHFTEISEDMAAHREAIMEALKKIHEVFRALPVEDVMSSAALEPFKEKTRPYVFILNREPPGKPTFEDVMLWYEKMSKPVERTALERVLVGEGFGYVATRDTIEKMMRVGKFVEHPIRGPGFLDVPPPPPVPPPPLPTSEEVRNRVLKLLKEVKRTTYPGIKDDIGEHFKVEGFERLRELGDKLATVVDEMVKEGIIRYYAGAYEMAVPPPKLLDPSKSETDEVRSVSRGPFRFVLLNNGTIRVASMGRFLTKEELSARPELLEETRGYFAKELETLGIKPPVAPPPKPPEIPLLPVEGVTPEWIEAVKKVSPAVKPSVAVGGAFDYSVHLDKWIDELGGLIPMSIHTFRRPPEVEAFLKRGEFEGWTWSAEDIKYEPSYVEAKRIWDKVYTRGELEALTRKAVDKVARVKGFPVRGTKADVINRILGVPVAPPTPPPTKAPPPRRPPPTRLSAEEVEEVWEQFVAYATAAAIVEPLAYRDRFIETIRTSPTVANAIERARRLVSKIQRELVPAPPLAPPVPPLMPAPEDVGEVYRRLGLPPGARVSETAFQTVWRAILRERDLVLPAGLIRSELDYLWREFADFLRRFDMDPERYRAEFEEVINPDLNLTGNLDQVMKKVHELTDSERWGPERWR